MAPIKVICAGYGRSGTVSLCHALKILGYNCHHMMDLVDDPDCSTNSLAFHNAYLNKNKVDLDVLYAGYDACADFTAATFYKEMLAKYPDSKVILTERPVDSWFKSVEKTLFVSVPALVQDPNDPNHELGRLGMALVFDGLMKDPENLKRKELFTNMYLNHNAEVKRVVPAERLYVMQTGEGWEGICKFLGKEIPSVPYPNTNSTKNFNKSFRTDNLAFDGSEAHTVDVSLKELEL